MTNTEAATELREQEEECVAHAKWLRESSGNAAPIYERRASAYGLGAAALEAQFTDAEREAMRMSLSYSMDDARHLPATNETRMALESALAKVTR